MDKNIFNGKLRKLVLVVIKIHLKNDIRFSLFLRSPFFAGCLAGFDLRVGGGGGGASRAANLVNWSFMNIKFFIEQKAFVIREIATKNCTHCQRLYFKIVIHKGEFYLRPRP